MGLNFRKSIKLGKGVKLNLGKKSMGMSFGGKGGGVSFNSKSGARARVSIPGTGISYTTKIGGSSKKKSTKKTSSTSQSSAPVTVQVEVNAKVYWYLTLFLGWLGIHRFYRRDWKMGFLYFFTYGLLFIGWIYDIVEARRMIKELEGNTETTTSNIDASYSEPVSYLEYQSSISPYSAKYFKGLEEIESMWSVMYNLKVTDGEKADMFEDKCKQNIQDFRSWIAISQQHDPNFSAPPHVPAYVRLAMLYEKQGRYEEGINICVEAIKAGATTDGNKGKMYGRLARLIKKSGLTVSEETLQLSMKTE